MPPQRNIRHFFKPVTTASEPQQQPSPSSAPKRDQTTSSRPLRVWPSPAPPPSTGPIAGPQTTSSNPRGTYSPEEDPMDLDAKTTPARRSSEFQRHPSGSSFCSNSSHRLVKNGEEVVTNTDSDTDSSDDDLPKLNYSTLTPQAQPKPAPAVKSKMEVDDGRPARSTRHTFRQRKSLLSGLDRHFKPAGPSLSTLVEQTRQDAERERRIAQAKALLDEPIEQSVPSGKEMLADENALIGMIQGDDDGEKAQRVLLAVKRTNTVKLNCVWHAFDEGDSKSSMRKASFPSHVLKKQPWASSLRDSDKRELAFLSGFATQIFLYQELPEELALWMINELARSSHEALKIEYINIMTTQPKLMRRILTPAKLDEIYHSLGGKNVIEQSYTVVPSLEPPQAPRQSIPPSTPWLVQLFHHVVPSLTSELRLHALKLLLLVSFDDTVLRDVDLRIMIQEAVEAILCAIPEAEIPTTLHNLTQCLLGGITHPVLQHNLVASLPANTPLTASFQRHLALSFFLHPTPLDVDLTSHSLFQIILTHMRTAPALHVTKDTNYSSLAALICLLDIGIGPGLSTVPYSAVPSSTSTGTNTPLLTTASSHVSTIPASAIQSTQPLVDEKAFNARIDELARLVKLLSNDIIEVGAMSQLTKLDAKDASERLFYRLESAVRAGGRKRKVMFGSSVQEGLSDRARKEGGIGGFFKKRDGTVVGGGGSGNQAGSVVNGA